MLVQLKKEEFDHYIDFAYQISLDLSKSCYPSYADGIKTKEDFVRIAKESLYKRNYEIYLFYYENQLEGWINFYYLPEDKYLACETFSVVNHQEIALEEFMKYLKTKFTGYEFYFGCSTLNQEAMGYLTRNDFNKIEESQVCLFNFKEYSIRFKSK